MEQVHAQLELENINPISTHHCGSLPFFVEVLNGDNDVEFLQWAGPGVAMKNARESLKQLADEVLDWTNVCHFKVARNGTERTA